MIRGFTQAGARGGGAGASGGGGEFGAFGGMVTSWHDGLALGVSSLGGVLRKPRKPVLLGGASTGARHFATASLTFTLALTSTLDVLDVLDVLASSLAPTRATGDDAEMDAIVASGLLPHE